MTQQMGWLSDTVFAERIEMDGLSFRLVQSIETIQDNVMLGCMMLSQRSSNFTEEELADWRKYDCMLNDPKFWKGAMERVEFEYEYHVELI